MKPVLPARRRAEEFQSLVERSSTTAGRDATSPAPAELAELADLVTALREVPPPAARPEFVADLRERLMAQAETVLVPTPAEERRAATTAPARRSPRERRIAAAVGGFAIVSASASMAVAAQTSLPGDTLYPLKRAIEDARTGLQGDADDRGTALLDNASGRLDEVTELTRDDGSDAQTISETLADFSQQATEASSLLIADYEDTGSEASLEDLRTFTTSSMTELDDLQAVVPDDARASLIEAVQVVRDIDQRARDICPACTEALAATVPTAATAPVDEALRDAVEAVVRPPAPAEPRGDEQRRPGAGANAPADDEAAPEPDSGTTSDPTPSEPSLPASTGGSGGSGGSKDDGLVGKVTKGVKKGLDTGNDDPLGDVLRGTGDAVDGVGQTVDDTVDGLLGGG